VEDFGEWKAGYDGAASLRDEHGVRADGLYQAADDPNDVTVFHDFDSADAAAKMIGDPRLAEIMKELGVTGEPQIWITTEA
jgi:hypothetical protein